MESSERKERKKTLPASIRLAPARIGRQIAEEIIDMQRYFYVTCFPFCSLFHLNHRICLFLCNLKINIGICVISSHTMSLTKYQNE